MRQQLDDQKGLADKEQRPLRRVDLVEPGNHLEEHPDGHGLYVSGVVHAVRVANGEQQDGVEQVLEGDHDAADLQRKVATAVLVLLLLVYLRPSFDAVLEVIKASALTVLGVECLDDLQEIKLEHLCICKLLDDIEVVLGSCPERVDAARPVIRRLAY
jgi:hypothetical protein